MPYTLHWIQRFKYKEDETMRVKPWKTYFIIGGWLSKNRRNPGSHKRWTLLAIKVSQTG